MHMGQYQEIIETLLTIDDFTDSPSSPFPTTVISDVSWVGENGVLLSVATGQYSKDYDGL